MEKLFWKIFGAQDENQLHDIVTKNTLLMDNSNWHPYGGDNSNFSLFDSQSANPVPALVEKVINSIDSLLLKQCRLKKIDPKSDEAPTSMSLAVDKFFGIKNGDFSEVSQSGRRSIAEEIQVIAEGDKQTPNIIIYDNGEGQHPDDFSSTFLSLLKRNKTDISFVQGKYNMGSTGAVIFCGEHRYQLIGSKLCDDLNTKKHNNFGFTLVRKHPLTEQEERGRIKTSWYEYFVIDGKIPNFLAKQLDLGLYNRQFKTGSIVKLYSYVLPRGSRSSIVWDLWRDLNQYLYHPALPFLVYEKRWPNQKTPSKPVTGNKIRLTLDERDKKEKTITINISDALLGEIPIEAHVFNPGVDQKEFINNKAVVFSLNGQVQGCFPRQFISQDLGYSLLRDSLLVQVDCTKVKTSVRQDLFKGSRDRLNEGSKTELLVDKIISTLKDNEELRALNQARKNRILRENSDDKNLLENIFANLPIDDEVMKLLKNNAAFNLFKKLGSSTDGNENNQKKGEKKPKYVSKRFPSIFKIELNENDAGKKIKSIPLNGKGVVNFETDVEDEYLFRPKDKGELSLIVLGVGRGGADGPPHPPVKPEDMFDITKTGPTDNSIRITFEPKNNLNVGDEIKLNARLSSPDGNFESIFWVKIVDPKKESDKPSAPKKEENIAPPMPIRVFKSATQKEDRTWTDYGWDGNDVVKVITNQENKKQAIIEGIAVNMDCFSLQKFISKNKVRTAENINLTKNKFFLSVYLHSLFLYSIFDRINKDEDSDSQKIDIEEIITMLFKPYSSFLLSASMLENQLEPK